jgi:hypothetical protein
VASFFNGQVVPQFEYEISQTPCRDLAHASSLIVPELVQTLYPESSILRDCAAQGYAAHRLENSLGRMAGVLVLVFREPLKESQTALLHSTLPVTHGCPVLLVHELPCAQAMHEPLPLHTLS